MSIPASSELDIVLSEDGTNVVLSILKSGKVKSKVNLSADQVDRAVSALVNFRCAMEPEIAKEFPQNGPAYQTGGTAYHVGIEPFLNVAILSFRHPGLGWLSFQVAEEVIRKILDQIARAKARLPIIQSDTKQ